MSDCKNCSNSMPMFSGDLCSTCQEYEDQIAELQEQVSKVDMDLSDENADLRDRIVTITAERDDLERVVEVLAGRLVMVHVGCKEVPNNSIHSWTEWAKQNEVEK
jgi:hypothetical protein